MAKNKTRMCRAACCALAACFLTGPASAQVPTSRAAPTDYSFLRGSQWYVPSATLPAANLILKNDAVRPVLDQTVWDIIGYQKGYFWGRSVASFTQPVSGKPVTGVSCSRFLGSVTPSGRVYITFVPDGDTTTSSAVTGIGTLSSSVTQGWTFEMQMATGSAFVLAHWSYMYQCKAGQACEARLPGTRLSLQDFLAQCS
ncbi:MAG TPA: hypothetical protein VHD14_18855 [Pseudolabrys sp.]|jgi:hypothetical protein|nr:hypothetical protein [Pseudolabrys sp.]